MPKAKNVTIIPATINLHTKMPAKERVRRKIGRASCRERV